MGDLQDYWLTLDEKLKWNIVGNLATLYLLFLYRKKYEKILSYFAKQ